ncbi:MAG: hypothetical protein DVB31_00915, partial [Verrucomicrobia bacterium]
ETLHLKVLARRWDGDGWQFPTNRSVQLQLVGPRGDTTLRTNLALGPGGAADWTWMVPVGTRGTYRAHLECGPARLDREVEVRDFQPAAFDVALKAKPSYGPGEAMGVPFTARYLFGQDLANARLLWSANGEDFAFAPTGWTSFAFCQGTGDWRLRPQSDNPGVTHADGSVEIAPGVPRIIVPELPPNPIAPQPQRVQLTAEVTDLDQQTIAAQTEFVRHASAFYLGFRWSHGEESVLATNVPLAFQLVAVRNDGQPWPVAVDATVRLRRVEWKSVAVQRAGRVVGHQSEPEFHDVAESRVRTQGMARAGERWETADATDAGTLPALGQPGQYLLEFSARDDAGNGASTTVGFHVTGDGRLAWHARNGAEVELVADTATHAEGDTATLLVKAPFDATALVTVEREDVRRAFSIPLRGNAPAIRVPIGAHDGPNVFVGVALVRGSAGNPHAFPMPEWRVGYQTLSVPTDRDRLRVVVKSGPAVARPGDTIAVHASVRDAAGNAVPGAETTLYAVDEGYLVLKGTEAPAPFEAFAEPRRLGVTTTLSLPGLLPEDPRFRSFANKGHVAGGGGQAATARRNFVPCPFWNASLATDDHGDIAVSFVAPDSLTRYRVVAVATHGPRAMGTGIDAFEVRKPLMIESALPRFAHVGDRLVARALVFNQSGRPLSVRADLVPGTNAAFATAHAGPVRIEVASEGTAVVEFPVRLESPGTAEWKWSVVSDAMSDAVTVSLPVTHAEADLREVRHLLAAAGSTNLLAAMDTAMLEQPDALTLRIAASPIAFLGESAHQLVHYPYGCVEQTGSSLLPWIALRDFPGLLPPDQRAATNVDAALAAGVRRFWSMQTADGGLAYWPGGTTPQRWGSAYGAWVLALARGAGADVPTNRLARLHKWLDGQCRADPPNPDPESLHLRCLTALALAAGDAADAGLLESLGASRDRLSPEDRAMLALALLQTRDDREGASALLRMPPGQRPRHGAFGSDARVDALRLLAHARLDPQSAETTGLLDSLVLRRQGGHWATTQGNAWALWAIADHARRSGPPRAIEGEVRIGTTTRRFSAGTNDPLVALRLPLTAADAASGVTLSHALPFPLHLEAAISGRRTAGTNPAAAIHRGFSLRRTYEKLDAKNRPGPIEGLRVGDRVLVTLDIDAADPAEWVAIDDPLPAVLEPSQGTFRTEGKDPGGLAAEGPCDFVEVRSDRRMAFIDVLPEGRHRVRYLARVRAAGDVVAAPAKIEAMYKPQRHGFSEGTRLHADAAAPTPP